MATYVLKVKKEFRGVEENRKIKVGEIIEITSEERLQRMIGLSLVDLMETRVEEDKAEAKEGELDDLSYSELQDLAKKHDIPANQKKTELIEQLKQST